MFQTTCQGYQCDEKTTTHTHNIIKDYESFVNDAYETISAAKSEVVVVSMTTEYEDQMYKEKRENRLSEVDLDKYSTFSTDETNEGIKEKSKSLREKYESIIKKIYTFGTKFDTASKTNCPPPIQLNEGLLKLRTECSDAVGDMIRIRRGACAKCLIPEMVKFSTPEEMFTKKGNKFHEKCADAFKFLHIEDRKEEINRSLHYTSLRLQKATRLAHNKVLEQEIFYLNSEATKHVTAISVKPGRIQGSIKEAEMLERVQMYFIQYDRKMEGIITRYLAGMNDVRIYIFQFSTFKCVTSF